MTTVSELAQSLEDYASSRAEFRNATNSQREKVASWLVQARVQVRASDAPDNTRGAGAYTRALSAKKNRFFYACAEADISISDAEGMWWNYVYDGIPPAERVGNV